VVLQTLGLSTALPALRDGNFAQDDTAKAGPTGGELLVARCFA
jgi:hypothetical protein